MDIDFIVRRRKNVHKHHTQSEPLPAVQLILSFGLNDKAQLSLGNFEKPTKCIEKVDLERVFGVKGAHIVKIACGGYHTVILMDDGTVYGVGENGFGQVRSNHYIYSPLIIDWNRRYIFIFQT
jgi:alpha-tubulin suppressor-like RCC1 family protein